MFLYSKNYNAIIIYPPRYRYIHVSYRFCTSIHVVETNIWQKGDNGSRREEAASRTIAGDVALNRNYGMKAEMLLTGALVGDIILSSRTKINLVCFPPPFHDVEEHTA